MKKEPPGQTVSHLVWLYRTQVLPGLGLRTQADYRKRLDQIEGQFGSLSLRAMSSDDVARYIIKWRDELGDRPRQADYRVQVLSAVLGWGLKQRLISKNQAANIDRLYSGDRRDSVWTEEQEAAFLSVAPEPMRLAFVLAIETGQRQADLLKLAWTNVDGDIISLRQQKTHVDVAIPISPRLARCLDEARRGSSLTVLTTDRGLPWNPRGNGFRSAWREVCGIAGISGPTFHDLRGTFATRRMAEGWSTEDVAFCTGHSLRDLASLERYVSRGTVAAKRARAKAKRLAETTP
jgi:integrase